MQHNKNNRRSKLIQLYIWYSYIGCRIWLWGWGCRCGSHEHWLVCLFVFLVTALGCHSDIWNIKCYQWIFPPSNIHLTLKWCLLWPLTFYHQTIHPSAEIPRVTAGHDPCCACRRNVLANTAGGEQLYSVKCLCTLSNAVVWTTATRYRCGERPSCCFQSLNSIRSFFHLKWSNTGVWKKSCIN